MIAGPGQGNQGFRMNPNQEQEQKSPLEQFVSVLRNTRLTSIHTYQPLSLYLGY